jgi:hypothetical protein
MPRQRRRRGAVLAIAAGAAVLAAVPLFVDHAPAARDVRARVVRAAAAWSAAAPPRPAASAGGAVLRDAPDPEAEAAALPRGTIVAVHGDARVATQRRLLARLGGAAGLTRATENALAFEAFDAHLAKAARARAARGSAARRKRNRTACAPRAPTFATSARKDYRGFVAEELLELGLCPL